MPKHNQCCLATIEALPDQPWTAQLAEKLSPLWWWSSPSWRLEISFWLTARWKDWKDCDCEACMADMAAVPHLDSRTTGGASSRPPGQASGSTRLTCRGKSLNKTPMLWTSFVHLCSMMFCVCLETATVFGYHPEPPQPPSSPLTVGCQRKCYYPRSFCQFPPWSMDALGEEPGGCERRKTHVSFKFQHPHRGRNTYLIWRSISCCICMRDIAWLFMYMSG